MAESWSIAGTYFESCNCEVACSCIFLGPPTTGECTVLVAWHIDKGTLGATDLGGLNVVLSVHSPGDMAKVPWKVALYLDDGASQGQRDALVQIFGGQAGGHFALIHRRIGELVGIKSAAIDYMAEGKRRSIRIAGIAEADIEAIDGIGGSQVTISNNPVGIVPGEPLVVARSTRLSYHDHGMDWEITEKNAYYSPFTYQGP